MRNKDKKIQSIIPSSNINIENYERNTMYYSMFCEDIVSSIFPYSSKRKATITSHFSEKIPNEKREKLEEVIISNLPGRDHYSFGTNERLSDFVSLIANESLKNGKFSFEVIMEKDEQGGLIELLIQPIIGHKNFLGINFQKISRNIRKSTQTKKCIQFISRNKIMSFRLPRELGTPRKMKRSVKRLNKIGGYNFRTTELLTGKDSNKLFLDITKIHDDIALEVMLLTKKFGWNQRGSQNKKVSDYYIVYQELLKKRMIIIFREKIIKDLNDFLKKNQIGIFFEIDGDFSLEDIDGLLEEAHSGQTPLDKILQELTT